MIGGTLWRMAACVLALAAHLDIAGAASVSYDTLSLGGQTWRYNFILSNSAPSQSFDEVTLYFDFRQFANLSGESSPAGWDALVVQPDVGLASDGFLDVLSLAGPVPSAGSVAQFSLTVDYLGSGTPGAQRFELIEAGTFKTVYSGTASSAAISSVPEPKLIALLLASLGALVLARRQFNACN